MSRTVHCPKHYYSPGELSESDPAVPATPHLSVGWSALNQTDHKSYPGTLLHCLFVISRQSKIPIKFGSLTELVPTVPNEQKPSQDRKSTRLNSSHVAISYAVFCLTTKNRIIDLKELPK